MTQYHWHHIIPKHAGGSNEPENLIRLTIPEHAEAHRKLYEEHGRIQDKIAWLMLSGKTDEGEILRKELAIIKRKEWQENNPEEFEDVKRRISEKNKGKIKTKETRLKQSKSLKERYSKIPHHNLGKKASTETKQKLSKIRKGKKFSEEHKEKIRQNMLGRLNHQFGKGRTYEVTSPTGEKLIVNNLKKFALAYRLHISQIYRVAAGKYSQIGGYKIKIIDEN